MPVRMMNTLELRQIVEVLDTIAPIRTVSRALDMAGVTRDLLRSDQGFLPYIIEAVVLEAVARSLGERSLGALVGQRFDYNCFAAFADYVLAAPNLTDALVRSQRAIHFLHPGANFSLRQSGDNLVFGYRSGLETAVGHRHLSEGSIFIITHVFRHYLGQDWRPAWIDVPKGDRKDEARLQDLTGTEIRGGSEILAFGVSTGDLLAPSPSPSLTHAKAIVAFGDLPVLMGVRPPKTTMDKVSDVMRAQLLLGDLSEESVARRLSTGTRTLQRLLMAEGVSYRELRSQLIEARASALLLESDIDIDEIAKTLGYSEPNSFRRAFRKWTGFSPGRFRRERRPR